MADVAKVERTTAKTKFTCAERSLRNALTSDNIPIETISRRFNDFKRLYEKAETAHDNFTALLQPEGDENTEEDWITEL